MVEIVCTVCPRGCRLQVDGEKVTGNTCPRGAVYGVAEATHPVRMLTATVGLDHPLLHRLPVRTQAPIPRELLRSGMKSLEGITVTPPVAVGQVLVKYLLGTGVDVIAARTVPSKEEL